MVLWRINLFSDKINIKKVPRTLLYTRNLGTKTIFPQTLLTYCLFINKPLNYKQESLSVGRGSLVFLLNSEVQKYFLLAQVCQV